MGCWMTLAQGLNYNEQNEMNTWPFRPTFYKTSSTHITSVWEEHIPLESSFFPRYPAKKKKKNQKKFKMKPPGTKAIHHSLGKSSLLPEAMDAQCSGDFMDD